MTSLHERREPAISSMFNTISGKYDILNHLLSFGTDIYWRRTMVRMIKQRNKKEVLDIACGTGDLTLALWKEGMNVTGLDIAEKMVEIARKKSARFDRGKRDIPRYIISSASDLPFNNSTFDAVTISFGIRNFEDRKRALNEIKRVLKPSGLVAIMEFSTPGNRFWRFLFGFYFNKVLPLAGKIISRHSQAYSYLPESVSNFPVPEKFSVELRESGFTNLTVRSLTGNIAIIYLAYNI